MRGRKSEHLNAIRSRQEDVGALLSLPSMIHMVKSKRCYQMNSLTGFSLPKQASKTKEKEQLQISCSFSEVWHSFMAFDYQSSDKQRKLQCGQHRRQRKKQKEHRGLDTPEAWAQTVYWSSSACCCTKSRHSVRMVFSVWLSYELLLLSMRWSGIAWQS